MNRTDGLLIILSRYVFAILLPPVAVVVMEGLGLEFLIDMALTLGFSLPYALYVGFTSSFATIDILLCISLALPGSIYAVWITTKCSCYSEESEVTIGGAPPVIQPQPQRLATAYQQGFLPALTPSPVAVAPMPQIPSDTNRYSGKYSPLATAAASPFSDVRILPGAMPSPLNPVK